MKLLINSVLVLTSAAIFSNSGCKKDATQDLCVEPVSFKKESWLKEKIEFFNWEYSDYAGNEDQINRVYEMKYNNNTYFAVAFKGKESSVYDCTGRQLDPSQASELALINTLKAQSATRKWPVFLLGDATGDGLGGGGGGSW